MFETEEIFRNDAYCKQTTGKVIAVDEHGVYLDRTIFYPLGGGQPGDSGTLSATDGSTWQVVDTRKSHDGPATIVHILADSDQPPEVGSELQLTIDWEKRYRFMRTHSCLHLLGSVLKFPVTGGNISEAKGRLDFDMTESPDKADVEQRLNQLIQEDHTLEYSWITDEEMQANMELVRTMSVQPPMGQGRVRLVNIPDVDLQPCGGTHVRSTAEIGAVRIGKVEKKGKQNRRVNIHLLD